MPMSFPDMMSLMNRAQIWKFRMPHDGEKEAEYRMALYAFVLPKDSIEAGEIRTGKGWDQWNETEKLTSLFDAMMSSKLKKGDINL